MRLIVSLCVVLSLGQESATAQEIKEDGITLNVRNASVEQVINELSEITHLKFFYDQSLMNNRPLVTLRVSRGKISDILNELTKLTNLTFSRSHHTVTVAERKAPPTSLAVKNCKLSGRVVDASTQAPLSGANIYLPRYRQGRTSNDNGTFELPVPMGKAVEIQVSYVGYITRTYQISLSKDSLLNVELRQDNRLSEVEVLATKQEFSVESSQMSAIEMPIEQVKRLPSLFGETDVLKALQKLPGVQASNDGQAGIFVRGGNYDQNQITMDGATLYNAEHLKGFVSAINTDMVDNLVFYKGAFPARYGGQLSSVVDVGMKSGNFERYHGELNLGVLSSRVHMEGPLWRNRTSLNIGARASYFDWLVQPILENVADNKNAISPYANVNYYDVTAKLTHLFSTKNRLSLFFYWGNDVNDASPTTGSMEQESESTSQLLQSSSSMKNDWGNLASSLNWTYQPNEHWYMNTYVGYSSYRYNLTQHSYQKNEVYSKGVLHTLLDQDKQVYSHSGVDELSAMLNFNWVPTRLHSLRWGVQVSHRTFNPVIEVNENGYERQLLDNGEYAEQTWQTDTIIGHRQQLTTASVYIEDDWTFNKQWKANIGLRYALFQVKQKTYHSVEPRVSLRWMFRNDMSLKASYTRMAQGFHLLSSSNLVMPSDIWVSSTKHIPLMKSDQWALGYSYELLKGVNLSVEGFYKRMNNLLEYREGYSPSSYASDWAKWVVTGKGESYGAELLLQKSLGNTTGWIAYTWSKSLRLFDRPGEELFSGRKYYAGNDRRHNLNIVFNHRFNKHWDVSLTWTYQSGRRGTLPTTSFYGAMPDESGSTTTTSSLYLSYLTPDQYSGSAFIGFFPTVQSYKERNGYQLPAIHRLDGGVTYRLQHGKLESRINLSVYNIYNHQNISNVYLGYDNNRPVLKGICLLPVMPSISYTLKL